MQIRQISATLDAKLAQLDQQLKQLEEQHQGNASDPKLIKDIAALHQMEFSCY